MTVTDAEVDLIAARLFDEWADSRGYTIPYRAPLRRPFVEGFRKGLELGVQLAQPKRRSKSGG